MPPYYYAANSQQGQSDLAGGARLLSLGARKTPQLPCSCYQGWPPQKQPQQGRRGEIPSSLKSLLLRLRGRGSCPQHQHSLTLQHTAAVVAAEGGDGGVP